MASDQKFVDHILDQLSEARDISARKMFGEYGVFSGEKMVAMICDNQFFVKPTAGGRDLLGEVVEVAPFPRAKPCFRIDDGMKDRAMLARLIAITAAELPVPKPKRKRAPIKL